jgi:hypothetical protein
MRKAARACARARRARVPPRSSRAAEHTSMLQCWSAKGHTDFLFSRKRGDTRTRRAGNFSQWQRVQGSTRLPVVAWPSGPSGDGGGGGDAARDAADAARARRPGGDARGRGGRRQRTWCAVAVAQPAPLLPARHPPPGNPACDARPCRAAVVLPSAHLPAHFCMHVDVQRVWCVRLTASAVPALRYAHTRSGPSWSRTASRTRP